MITATIDFPASLPRPQREGHTARHAQPFARTDMASGRARQRRRFTSVPSVQTFTWLCTQGQSMALQAWFRDALNDGVEWFNINVRTDMGVTPLVCRFQEMYTGPDLVGRNSWRISAPLEVWERPLAPIGWGLMPDYIVHGDMLDIAMNKEWPEVK